MPPRELQGWWQRFDGAPPPAARSGPGAGRGRSGAKAGPGDGPVDAIYV
jgi:hypothetical protein